VATEARGEQNPRSVGPDGLTRTPDLPPESFANSLGLG